MTFDLYLLAANDGVRLKDIIEDMRSHQGQTDMTAEEVLQQIESLILRWKEGDRTVKTPQLVH